MKRLALALTLFTALAASAQPRSFTVRAQESVTLQIVGATAAYTIDPNIADAAAYNGGVTLTGRSAGKTQLVVVTFAGQSFSASSSRKSAASPRHPSAARPRAASRPATRAPRGRCRTASRSRARHPRGARSCTSRT